MTLSINSEEVSGGRRGIDISISEKLVFTNTHLRPVGHLRPSGGHCWFGIDCSEAGIQRGLTNDFAASARGDDTRETQNNPYTFTRLHFYTLLLPLSFFRLRKTGLALRSPLDPERREGAARAGG